MPKHTLPRVLYRAVSGRSLDGVPRTDGGYLRRGTRVLTATGRASRWAKLPGWQRQAVRLGVPAAAYGVHQAYTAAPTYTTAASVTLAAVGGVQAARKARQAWRMRRFHSVYTAPTVEALSEALGKTKVTLHIDPSLGDLVGRLAPDLSPAERMWRGRYAKYVEPTLRFPQERAWKAWTRAKRAATPLTSRLEPWRRPRKDYGPSITFSAPDRVWLSDDERSNVAAIVSGKVPVSGLTSPAWDAVGKGVTARWTVRKRPPKEVGVDAFKAYTAGLDEWEYWLGLAADNKSTKISLKGDNPHIGISAASGAGKSELAKLFIVQTLQRGGEVFILDIKGSHAWAYGLPGVTYCRTDKEIHRAWVTLGKLALWRNDVAFLDPEVEKTFRRVVVIAEELNGLMDALADYWADTRETTKDRDPAMRGLRDILRMGRSAMVNIIAIAQRLSAAASGNGDARENLGSALCLARFSENTWRMLCRGLPMPRVPSDVGRWIIVTGSTVTEMQACYLDPRVARLMVLASAPAPASACPPVRKPDGTGADLGMSGGQPDAPDMPADPLAELVTLTEAADRKLIPWHKPDTARVRLKRSKERGSEHVPEVRGMRGASPLYSVGDLIAWAESELVR